MKRLAEMSQRGHDINEKKIKGRGVIVHMNIIVYMNSSYIVHMNIFSSYEHLSSYVFNMKS